jgi:hypothetical protein
VDNLLQIEGTLELAGISCCGSTRLRGSGQVVNRGLMKLYGPGGPIEIEVPVRNEAAGRLWLTDGAQLKLLVADLTNAGVVQMDVGAQLRLENSNRRLVALAGSQILGSGDVRFENSTRLDVLGNTTLESRLFFAGDCIASGAGLLTLKNHQELAGLYGCPVALADGADALIQSATFTNRLNIASNGVVRIADNFFLRNDGVITNRGTMYLASSYSNSRDRLTGAGLLVNAGRCEVHRGDVNSGAAIVRNRVIVVPSGRLVVNTNAYLWLGTTSSLLNAGVVEVQTGGKLEMIDTAPFDFVLFAKARITGNGLTTLGGNGRLYVPASATLEGGTLALTGSSTMAGYGLLTIAPGATFSTDHSVTFSGSVIADGTMTLIRAGITNQINSAFTLGRTGTLNNPGTVRVGFYFNYGGLINGNAPVLISPGVNEGAQERARIERLALESQTIPGPGIPAITRDAILQSTAPAERKFQVEVSTDLREWGAVSATIREVLPGHYEARTSAQAAGLFFRVRSVPGPGE